MGKPVKLVAYNDFLYKQPDCYEKIDDEEITELCIAQIEEGVLLDCGGLMK